MEEKLVDSLLHKLDELEHKVQLYRKTVVEDFHQYYYSLVKGVSPPINGSEIQQAIAPSFVNYPTLCSELQTSCKLNAAPTGSTHSIEAIDKLPIASGIDTFQSPGESVFGKITQGAVHQHGLGLGSEVQHEREEELQGLFIPSYLPLLDINPPPPSLPPNSVNRHSFLTSSVEPSATTGSPRSPQPGFTGEGRDTATGRDMDLPKDAGPGPLATAPTTTTTRTASAPAQLLPVRPSSTRRATDDAASSTTSDKSDSQPPRSALRRASTPGRTPTSPRRVRFEFEGLEVLPTASPRATDLGRQQPTSPGPPSPVDELEDSADELSAESILGPDEEENFPPPRKISSSDALRALSRTPLDSGTVWTVVNPDSEPGTPQGGGSPKLAPSQQKTQKFTPPAPKPRNSLNTIESNALDMALRGSPLGRVQEQPEEEEQVPQISADDDDASSDEEQFLSIGKSKSFNKKAIASPTKGTGKFQAPAEIESTENPDAASSDDLEMDEDEMFHFEDGGLSAPPRPRQKPAPLQKSEDEAEDSKTSPPRAFTFPPQLSATSPAVSIAKPPPPETPTSPVASKFHIGSVGSYKGRPVRMSVVKDPEVHARAASLGQFSTFVGGLDGRSGLDEGDLNSFRASFVRGSFSGAPRSLTERMMMEDAQAEQETETTTQ